MWGALFLPFLLWRARPRPSLSAPAPPAQTHYEQFHGFVVIHGTDTMAFAASVLAFVLENLRKTVVLTGAQVPWGRPSCGHRVGLLGL